MVSNEPEGQEGEQIHNAIPMHIYRTYGNGDGVNIN
jgi:hypothetical protein